MQQPPNPARRESPLLSGGMSAVSDNSSHIQQPQDFQQPQNQMQPPQPLPQGQFLHYNLTQQQGQYSANAPPPPMQPQPQFRPQMSLQGSYGPGQIDQPYARPIHQPQYHDPQQQQQQQPQPPQQNVSQGMSHQIAQRSTQQLPQPLSLFADPPTTTTTTTVGTSSAQAPAPVPAAHRENANLGFTPSKTLSKKHETIQQNATEGNPDNHARPLYSFQVTKLRSWRAGYIRLLRLYADHFCTLDPETHQVTNTWSYTALTDWLAVPKEDDTILLQVAKDKLKFKCYTSRSHVLTALLECKNGKQGDSNWVEVPFPQCQRQTRKMTRVPVSLQAAPYGLVECHPTTRKIIQTYRYTDIPAASFTSDDAHGIVLYHTKNCSAEGEVLVGRLYFIHSARQGGSGRSDLLTILQDHYTILGLEPLDVVQSTSVQQWVEKRRRLGNEKQVGPVATTWSVSKSTRRHHVQRVGSQDGWVGGIVSRQLVITGRGYLLERDGAGIVNCRPLSQLHAIVRVPNHDYTVETTRRELETTSSTSGGDQLELEFMDGTSVTYTCSNRDALLVSLLDATVTLGKKKTVQVSDVRSAGYCLSSIEDDTEVETAPSSGAAALFQPISIPLHCLKRVYAISTAAYAYITHAGEILEESPDINIVQECKIVVEACREFNASVLPTSEGLPAGEKDKTISGTVGALWGLVYELLQSTRQLLQAQTQVHVRDRHMAEQTACTLLQSLFRLSQTTSGYKVSVELTTMQDCIPLIWQIQDDFAKFWAFRILLELVSGKRGKMPHLRDMELEFVNKKVILSTGGPTLINGLVNALLESGKYVNNTDGTRAQRVNDLILMVASDILQSILCSYHDTTTPEHFSALIQALAKGYRALLSALRSSTPFVIENVALLLHLLNTHAPNTATEIRDAALSSATLLHHFHCAIFSPMEGQRFLSRYLCSLWMSGPMECDEKRLLKRMVPGGFLNYLSMPPLSRMEEEQLDALERDSAIEGNISESYAPTYGIDESGDPTVPSASEAAAGAAGTNTARLRSRITLASETAKNIKGGQLSKLQPENFRIFFHVLTKDHNLADLIWNQQTRRELRIALESELRYIRREAEARGIDNIAWNHQQFSVEYPSLENEVKVGGTRGVYMRLWLQAGDSFIKTWEDPVRLFEQLFRRFLCESDRNPKVTVMCIRCLERLYAIHASKIGPFSDAMILVRSMASTRSIETQHRLLGLLATILGVSRTDDGDEKESINIPENAEQFLNSESIEQLCQFVAWGHTNGVQVGNLLTTVLKSNQKMITDGTGSSPEGEGGTSSWDQSSSDAPDASCPPVWFVARTGRIPPPEESIRGPFRVSELSKMMQDGDLSPFDLVTATHVENYDIEDDASYTNGGLKESHIDTGKWKRVEQIWQLRWQLCTDGNDSGIFTPSDVALLATKSLSRLVDLHKSLDSQGVPYYPIPIAKRILCCLSRDPTESADSSLSQASQNRDSYLSILCQALLCNDYRVVEHASGVLHKLMMHNEEAIAKFYLTGVFFFICCYTGSNFRPLAELLHVTHLKQHFRSGFAAAAKEGELPMKERSVLGHMLPEGLLWILVNYGADKFTEVFVGNFDTPEVIWNFEMRKHLIEMIRQHLGDFPKRLWQNTTTCYEFCPMPGVSYKRLEKEIFCHNYYLNNLCDDSRFPNWPIAEPVEVFRACLEELKKQMTRDETEEEIALEDARKVLALKTGDGSKELRKAYRNQARLYHPDKNPSGRDTFEKIQAAYELLLPIVESGQTIRVFSEGGSEREGEQSEENVYEGFGGGKSQMQAIYLLLKTQLLICKRYEKEMGRYKYPAYRMLLSCLEIPPSCKDALNKDDVGALLFASLSNIKRAEFVKTAVALVYQTCLVSPMNSQELIVEDGVRALESILNFYVHAVAAMRKGNATEYDEEACVTEILSYVIHTIAGIAYFENGRAALLDLEDPSRLCINWRRCIDGRYLSAQKRDDVGDPSIKIYALEGIANMAKDERLQEMLIGSGVVWPMMKYMLGYDPTLDDVGHELNGDHDDVGISQAASNTQARLSARALGTLCGVLQDPALSSPPNELLSVACSKLLTSPVALMLRNKRTGEVLKTLNTNVETPARIWNVNMRNELNSFLTKMEQERPENECQSAKDELSKVESFEYSQLKEELRIGGVYVRVFNRMGSGREAIREVPNPGVLAKQVTDFVARSINASDDLPEDWIELPLNFKRTSELSPFLKEEAIQTVGVRDKRFLMAIKALLQLVRVDGLIDDVLCEPESAVPSILLSLLELPQDSETFDIGSDILSIMSPKQPFADAVAKEGALWRLLMVLERPESIELSDSGQEDAEDNAEDQEIIRRKIKGWALMESLSSTPSVATKIIESSCWLELLGILVGYSSFTKMWAARVGAAKTLSRLLWDPRTGPSAAPLLQKFLPSALVILLKEEGPDVMLKLFDGESDTPELIWDSSMRSELRNVLTKQLDECLARRKQEGNDSFTLPCDVFVKYKKLIGELYIGGVYVSRFLKEPTYNLRDSPTFLEYLLQRWTHEIQTHFTSKVDEEESTETSNALIDANQDVLQLVTSAAVYLCKIRESLCDKLAQWGYMARCLTFLDEILDRELYGSPLLSVMRLLHVAANRRINVESIAVSGRSDGKKSIVDFTIRGVGSDSLHPDSAFMIEMLKKVFKEALGDVEKAKSMKSLPHSQKNMAHAMAPSPAPGEAPVRRQMSHKVYPYMTLAMAPSPAPGEGQVQRGKVSLGDDPLAMFQGGGLEQAPQQQPQSYAQLATGSYPSQFQSQPQQHQFYDREAPSNHQSQQYPGPPFSHPPQQLSGPPFNHPPEPPSGPSFSHQFRSQGGLHQSEQQPALSVPQYNSHSSPASVGSQRPQAPPLAGSYAARSAQAHVSLPPHQLHLQRNRMQQSQYQQQSPESSSYASRSVAAFQEQPFGRPSTSMSTTSSGQSAQQNSYAQQQLYQSHQAQQEPHGPPGQLQTSILQQQQLHMHAQPMMKTQLERDPASMMQQPQLAGQLMIQEQRHPAPRQTMQQQGHLAPQQMMQHQGNTDPQQMMQQQQPQLASQQMQQRPEASTQSIMTQQQPQEQQASQALAPGVGLQFQHHEQHRQQSPGTATPFQNQNSGLIYQPQWQAQSQTQDGMQQPYFPQHSNQFNTGQQPPRVETVSDDNGATLTTSMFAGQQLPQQAPQYRPEAVAGTGVDARTKLDPKAEAEQMAFSSGGAPEAADGRVALLQAALVNELPKFLLEGVLENTTMNKVKDPAGTKVHAVELLKLLTMDPAYGMKFKLILDEMPAWKNYESQDHSLFITGSEQKADYFLTDGSSGEPNKMITQGE